MGLAQRIFGRRTGPGLHPLYAAAVAAARRPRWFAAGGVADTLDGRFDMLATVLALLLNRLQAEGERGRAPAARLAELFIADMDGQLRQSGVGDLVVGRHVGAMMSQLGGRSAALRDALAPGGDLAAVLARNTHRADAGDAALAVLAADVRALAAAIGRAALDPLLKGDFQ